MLYQGLLCLFTGDPRTRMSVIDVSFPSINREVPSPERYRTLSAPPPFRVPRAVWLRSSPHPSLLRLHDNVNRPEESVSIIWCLCSNTFSILDQGTCAPSIHTRTGNHSFNPQGHPCRLLPVINLIISDYGVHQSSTFPAIHLLPDFLHSRVGSSCSSLIEDACHLYIQMPSKRHMLSRIS